MKIYQTEFQQKMAKRPNNLEFNSVAFRRGLITEKNEVDAFRRSVAGFEGEQTVLDTSKNMGEDTGSLFQICGWIILEALNATWSFLQNINAIRLKSKITLVISPLKKALAHSINAI